MPKGRVEIPTAEQDTEHIDIRGRDGSLTKKYGYKNIEIPIQFTMFDTEQGFKPKFRRAKHHLLNAKVLIFDDDDVVYYKVKAVQIETSENIIRQFGEFTVNFTLDPFAYELNNEPITVTSQTTIENDGYTALPIITAQVSGTGKIYINDQEITIQNVNGSITIDGEMQNAYRAGSPPQNMNKHMIGRFPVLEKNSDNVIDFSGDISQLEIIPNRRWV